MARQWVVWVLAAVVGFGLLTDDAKAGLVDANIAFGAATAWDGFGEDFSPQWEGETTVVDSRFLPAWIGTQNAGTLGWTGSGCILSTNWNSNYNSPILVPGHWETRKTVRKISSSSDSAALSSAWLRYDGREYTAEKKDYDGAEMARYATLESSDGTVLANASAIACKSTDFGDDGFSADGRVSAFSIIIDTAQESPATLTAHSPLEAPAQLNQEADLSASPNPAVEVLPTATGRAALLVTAPPTPVADSSPQIEFTAAELTIAEVPNFQSLSIISLPSFDPALELSRSLDTGDVDVSAGATGRSWFDVSYELDRETAFSLDLDIARLGEVEITFIATNIETGEVAFSFTTVETGTQQEISMEGILEAGKYKFALNCLTDSSVDSSGGLNTGGQAMFDLALDLEEEYVDVWIPEHYEGGSGISFDLLSLGNFSAASSAVPEPSVLGLLILGGFVGLLVRRRRL